MRGNHYPMIIDGAMFALHRGDHGLWFQDGPSPTLRDMRHKAEELPPRAPLECAQFGSYKENPVAVVESHGAV